MIKTKDFKYIHADLDGEFRSIFYHRIKNGYEIILSNINEYYLDFKSSDAARNFLQRINCHNATRESIAFINRSNLNQIIIDIPKSEIVVDIDCGDNERLAIKLVKLLRKQRLQAKKQAVKEFRQQLKEDEKRKKQEVDSVGFKF